MKSSSMSIKGSTTLGTATAGVVTLSIPSDTKYRLERVTAVVTDATPFDGYVSMMMNRTGSDMALADYEPIAYTRRWLTVECDHLLLPGDSVVVRLVNATASSGAVLTARAWFRSVE